MSSRTIRGPAFTKPRSKLRKWLPVLLLLGAIGCLVGAFLQFRLSQEVRQATVILVMDASDSMLETDVLPSRLDAAKDAALSFLDTVPADFRVGLVTFAEEAMVRQAPTLDRSLLREEIEAITTELETAIGDGVFTALGSLEADRAANGDGPAAILLLTDGHDTASEVKPHEAADRARIRGTPVFTVLLGEQKANRQGVLNSVVLREMAETTGARMFNAQSADELEQVYANFGSRLSTELAVTDIGTPFLIAAGALGLAAGIVLVRGSEGADWR